jgi:hypothetical protein
VRVEFDPVAYLATKGLRGKPVSGGREITYACFFDCGEPGDSKKKKLYIQADTGLYQCKVCDASGGSYLLQKHFGDAPNDAHHDNPFARRRILDSATEVGETILHNNDDVLTWLVTERGLEAETVIERRLGFVAGGWSLTGSLPQDVTKDQLLDTGLVHRDGDRKGQDFFWRHVLIPYISRGHTIQMRGRAWGETKGGKYLTGPGEPVRLYNSDALDGAEDVIITEGEFDCIILSQALSRADERRARAVAVVGLAGTHALPDELLDLLSGAKRIYLGFDSDDSGRKAAETLAEKIGSRARVLTLPYENGRKCDWTEYLLPTGQVGSDWAARHPYAGHTWRDVMRLLSSASGKRLFSVAESGEAFRAYRNSNPGLKTGYKMLDGIIRPGLLPGQVLIFLAKTGAGKTTLLCNLAVNMRQYKVLFISLEMTREEVYDRLRKIYLFHYPRASDHDIDDALINVWICDENRLGENDMRALINEFVVESGTTPDLVIVDYLGYYARGAKGNSPYEKTSNAVMQLKADAKAGRYVLITPSQVNRGAKEGKAIDLDDARDAGSVEETADFLISLYRPDDGLVNDALAVQNQQPSGIVKGDVLKSRHGNKGKSLNLQMDLLTLAIVDEAHPLSKRAKQHNYDYWRGSTWDELRARETAPRQMKFDQFEGAQRS